MQTPTLSKLSTTAEPPQPLQLIGLFAWDSTLFHLALGDLRMTAQCVVVAAVFFFFSFFFFSLSSRCPLLTCSLSPVSPVLLAPLLGSWFLGCKDGLLDEHRSWFVGTQAVNLHRSVVRTIHTIHMTEHTSHPASSVNVLHQSAPASLERWARSKKAPGQVAAAPASRRAPAQRTKSRRHCRLL